MYKLNKRATTMKAVFTIALAGTMLAGLGYAMNSALSAPDVHVSYATNECVKVVNYTDETFSCDNLPSKFNHVWVQ
jgi:hypothetical protein